jgi:hypothetical protein
VILSNQQFTSRVLEALASTATLILIFQISNETEHNAVVLEWKLGEADIPDSQHELSSSSTATRPLAIKVGGPWTWPNPAHGVVVSRETFGLSFESSFNVARVGSCEPSDRSYRSSRFGDRTKKPTVKSSTMKGSTE